MRLFVALDIDDAVRERMARFAEGVSAFAPDARWMKAESLHVTLKFIGEQTEDSLQNIKESLRMVRGSMLQIQFRGYGFFPTAKSARALWIGMEAGAELTALAGAVDEKMAALGIPKEERGFSPHLTLARAAGGSGSPRWRKEDGPNRGFQRLQEKLAALPTPEFGEMTAREFFLYQSKLSPKGSVYTKLERFALK